MSTYLVTGGAGFIGSHIVEALAAEGHAVRVLDDFSTGREENLRSFAADIEVWKGDIRDRKLVEKAVHGVDYVLHLAAMISVVESLERPDDTLTVNIEGTANVLHAARERGVRRVVFSSSSSVYGNGPVPAKEDQLLIPLTPYAASKMAGEALAVAFYHSYRLPVVCLRYFNVYGPRQSSSSPYTGVIAIFSRQLLEDRPVRIFGDGRQTRDFIFVKDIVRANLLACEKEAAVGQVMNIGTGRAHTVRELHAVLADLCGSRLPPQFAEPRPGDIYHSRCRPNRARSLLGFRPQTDFRTGLKKTLEWQKRSAETGGA